MSLAVLAPRTVWRATGIAPTPATVALLSACLRDEERPDLILTIVRVMSQRLLGGSKS